MTMCAPVFAFTLLVLHAPGVSAASIGEEGDVDTGLSSADPSHEVRGQTELEESLRDIDRTVDPCDDFYEYVCHLAGKTPDVRPQAVGALEKTYIQPTIQTLVERDNFLADIKKCHEPVGKKRLLSK